MRKDKALSGDLDRLPMLTWIMFLKFLDDMEQIEENRARVGRKKYRPAIEPPYRWRDWAANEQGITGPELLAFIDQEEATRPDGKKGPGLFAYLRSHRATNGRADRRTLIATVFNRVDVILTNPPFGGEEERGILGTFPEDKQTAEALEHLPPENLVESILAKERWIIEVMGEVKAVLAKGVG